MAIDGLWWLMTGSQSLWVAYKTRKLTAQQIIQSFIQNSTQSNQIKSNQAM